MVMENPEQSRKIETKKRGNKLGFWFFKVFVRLSGLRGAYGLLYFVCLYYLLFDRSLVSGALAYISRRFPGSGFIKKRFQVYRLFVNQGKQLIDRYAVLFKPELFDLPLQGDERFISLLRDSRQGLILLTAHVGNWQVAMTALEGLGKTVYLVMRPEDNPAVQNSLHIAEEEERIKVISPEQHLGGVVEIVNVLKKGHIVSMMGDRSYGFSALEISFLGKKAWFPCGAFAIAAAAGCPVVFLLSAKVSAHRYIADVSHVFYPSYQVGGDKRRQLRQWVQEFAEVLESYVKRYPYQCFLFHDVWEEKTENIGQKAEDRRQRR